MTIDINQLKIGDVVPVPPKPKAEQEIMENWQGNLSKPLVSIVCHTFNHVNYIKDALNGFLMQETDFPFEIILHDDASTDGTIEIVKEYAQSYPNIIVPIIQTENQWSKGVKPSTNTFPKAKGKYIAFCEGDDYWTDINKLTTQAKYLEDHPDVSICGHNAIIIEKGCLIQSTKLPIVLQKDFSSTELKKGIFILTLTTMFVNKVFEVPNESGHFINGDTLMFSRLGEFGSYKFLRNISHGVYRKHKDGVWSSLDKQKQRANQINSYYWMSQYYSRIGDDKLASYFSQEAMSMILSNVNDIDINYLISLNNRLIKKIVKNKLSSTNRLSGKKFIHFLRRILL